MKFKLLLLFVLLYSITNAQVYTTKKVTDTDSTVRPRPFQYDKDAGIQYKHGDFTWITWAYAERLLEDKDRKASWRRVRQGMEFKFPAYNFRLNGNKFRTALVYEVDFTDNNFFKDQKWKIWENLFVTFQNADDPNNFRILFGENTHILSREDNLSSGNLPTINRSLILEQHGSTNSFGTQWGFQFQKQVGTKTFLQASLQDNRGSLNQGHPMFQFWNDIAFKVTRFILQPSHTTERKLNTGLAIDYTQNIQNKNYTLTSSIYQKEIGSTPATGNKLTFENNTDYTNTIGKHYYTLEYEFIYSHYSDQKLNVGGGYAQGQFQIFNNKKWSDLVPFFRYDIVNLSKPAEHGTEQALQVGFNYNLPFTHKLVNLHLEYGKHILSGSPLLLNNHRKRFDEFRIELRASATRYLRF